MNSPNIVLLTGEDIRHKYFIQHLNANFSISRVYIEKGNYPQPSPHSKEESEAWDWFFHNRDQYESQRLKASNNLPTKNKPRVTYLNKGELNSIATISKIDQDNPGFIAVFGISLLKETFLEKFPNKLFNLHIGDPEFYRGSSCSFWPIYRKELHHLSATIHQINNGIDEGAILCKQLIDIDGKDNEQTLLLKPIILGTQLMIQTIKDWQNGSLQPVPQHKTGNLYKKSDFTPKVILKLKQMVESGELDHLIQSMKK